MTWRHVLIGLGLLVVMVEASAAEAELGDFFGNWRCEELKVDGADPALVSCDDFDVEVTAHDSGFHIKSTMFMRDRDDGSKIKREPIDADFAPGGQPGVFTFEPTQGSLLSSLFADPSTGNPLEGDRLLWARLDGTTMHVYGLSVNGQGGFKLDHYQAHLDGDHLAVHYRLRLENDRVVTVEGRLVRAGG